MQAAKECQSVLIVAGSDATPMLEAGVPTFHGVAELVVLGMKTWWPTTS